MEDTAVQISHGEGLAALDPDSGRVFDLLRRKWDQVPAGLVHRRSTEQLLQLDDPDLIGFWTRQRDEACTGPDGFPVRGWYHRLYRDGLRGKRVLDVGSGLGFDGISFAQAGAELTFVDIVQTNLELLKRLCRLNGVEGASFHYMRDLDSLSRLPGVPGGGYDTIWCQGSLINLPFETARRERNALARHLKIGGRWVELVYPRQRWERDGRMPFEQWGQRTDGPGTPWMEWYDLPKLQRALEPFNFDVVLSFSFHHDDFHWFDLVRRD